MLQQTVYIKITVPSTLKIFCNKIKTKKTTLSEQFQNQIPKSYKEAISIPFTHKYMTTYFFGFVHALQ